jgi:hypothetical protein
MTSNPKFPGSVEIKRVIAAATRAGIEIGSVEIQPRKIVIHAKEDREPELSPYEVWKMSEGRSSRRTRHPDKRTGALPNNTSKSES